MSDLLLYLFLFFGFLGASWAFTGFYIRRIGQRHALDMPNERSSHAVPTPRGGGISVVLCVLGFSLAYAIIMADWSLLAYIGAAAFIALVSGYDDFKPLPAQLRMVVHVVAALIVLSAFTPLLAIRIPNIAWLPLGPFGWVISLLWMIGLTNAYNFMDGIDGMAGLQAVLVGIGWMILGILAQDPYQTGVGVVLAAASLGFLFYNWSPAKVFMGDVGSAFIGFTIASMPFMVARPTGDAAVVIGDITVSTMLLWPLLFDTIFTFLRRWRNGEELFAAHRSHLYQRLIISGFRHIPISLLYAALSGYGLLLAVWHRFGLSLSAAFILIAPAAIGLWTYVLLMQRAAMPALQEMLSFPLRNRYLLVSDLLLVPLAIYLAYVLRLDAFVLLPPYAVSYFLLIGFLMVTLIAIFWQSGLYARHWHYASIDELGTLVISTLAAMMLASLATFAMSWVMPVETILPRSLPLVGWLLTMTVTAGPRFLIRYESYSRAQRMTNQKARHHAAIQRVAIMGAGDAGVMIARELKQSPHLAMELVCFLDDDPRKHQMRIAGTPVLGDRNALPELIRSREITLVIIAIPTAHGRDIREIARLCKEIGVQTQIIPGLHELIGGAVTINQLRNVEIEDLLRREPIKTDISAIKNSLQGKRVLVTGAGGSIGSELCRQIIRHLPQKLILLGHGENSIFTIYHELREQGWHDKVEIVPVIADVRFPDRLLTVFQTHLPQMVFHAAAHKHVPLMEANPAEAITNNIFGTRHLLDASTATDVESFVLISTDKAVNPTSIMGVSKRLAELLVYQTAQETGRAYVTVRFGNVLGSRGSVVLTFKRQIASGGPVTVTHPDMTRYFMTIPEAVQLVLQARELGVGGEVFVLDMGEPVKIVDLAHDLITLSGLKVGRDIDIDFVGLRPGEKLYEELFMKEEDYRRTQHEKIFITRQATSLIPAGLETRLEKLLMVTKENNTSQIVQELQDLIPGFSPPQAASSGQ